MTAHASRSDQIEDKVTEDSAEQIVVKQYSCEECEFYVIYLPTWKGTKWLKMEELRVRMINVHDINDDENHKKLDEAETIINDILMLRMK